MTVIAYDGRYVAADRLISNEGGMVKHCSKLTVFEGAVLTTCGAADHGAMLEVWFKEGCKPEQFPAPIPGSKDAYLYVFKWKAPVMCFQCYPAPVVFDVDYYACGSGNEVAHTILHLGHSAEYAAKIACELNIFCGGGVDVIDLKDLAGAA